MKNRANLGFVTVEKSESVFPIKTRDAPLVYVYTGPNFPEYGVPSLRFSQAESGARVICLTESPSPRSLDEKIEWINIKDFYDPEPFKKFAETTNLPAKFRDGFWLHTAQRFFVLRDYMKFSNTNELFHAELDVLVYSLQALQKILRESLLHGVFMPRETLDRIVASLVYTNSQNAMNQLCEAITSGSHLGNEMDILGALDKHSAPWLHNLATAEYLYRSYRQEPARGNWDVLSSSYDYVVDGAVIGRWLFGVDPRNTDFRGTQNLIQEQKNTVPFELPMSQLRFSSLTESGKLRVRVANGNWHDIVAIHVHSKVHAKLSARRIRIIADRANRLRRTWIVLPELRWYQNFCGRIVKDFRLVLRSKALRDQYFARLKTKIFK